jgi:hypothetical protein
VITIYSNGVGQMHLKDGITLDVPEQMEHMQALNRITNNIPTPFIVTAGKQVTITKEARDNAIIIEKDAALCATAVIVQNLAYRLIADFYLKVQRPINPYRVFTDKQKEEAMKWCEQFVRRSNS